MSAGPAPRVSNNCCILGMLHSVHQGLYLQSAVQHGIQVDMNIWCQAMHLAAVTRAACCGCLSHDHQLHRLNGSQLFQLPLCVSAMLCCRYGIHCIGHSLGGGVAALLCYMPHNAPQFSALSKQVKRIMCTGFGTPPVMTPELAQGCGDYIRTMVHNVSSTSEVAETVHWLLLGNCCLMLAAPVSCSTSCMPASICVLDTI